MPLFMLIYGVSFSFCMYVIPGETGYVHKFLLSAGLAAAANVVLLALAPNVAMMSVGG